MSAPSRATLVRLLTRALVFTVGLVAVGNLLHALTILLIVGRHSVAQYVLALLAALAIGALLGGWAGGRRHRSPTRGGITSAGSTASARAALEEFETRPDVRAIDALGWLTTPELRALAGQLLLTAEQPAPVPRRPTQPTRPPEVLEVDCPSCGRPLITVDGPQPGPHLPGHYIPGDALSRYCRASGTPL